MQSGTLHESHCDACLCLQIIRCAAQGNREGVLKKSIEMKFLTGYESKVRRGFSARRHKPLFNSNRVSVVI